jgi:hypothetical protein
LLLLTDLRVPDRLLPLPADLLLLGLLLANLVLPYLLLADLLLRICLAGLNTALGPGRRPLIAALLFLLLSCLL